MKTSKVTNHSTASEAYNATTKNKVIAVKVTTYSGEDKGSENYYSYKSTHKNYDGMTSEDLYNDFSLSLASNQAIEEIDQFD